MDKKKVIIDSDIGSDVDDALALTLAAISPELQIEAVTVVGHEVAKRAKLARKVLNIAGANNVPIAAGISKPLIRDGSKVWARYGGHEVDITDPSLVYESRNAVDLLISKIVESERPSALITFGPLTNMAAAILIEPGIVSRLKEVFVMGGVVGRAESLRPLSEYNLAADPEAANIVFGSGLPITMVGLDVTLKVKLDEKNLERIASKPTPLNKFVYQITKHYYMISRKPFNYLHDPLTVGVAIDATLVKVQDMAVELETRGKLTDGWTIAYPAESRGLKPNAKVALEVNEDRFVEMFVNRLINRD